MSEAGASPRLSAWSNMPSRGGAESDGSRVGHAGDEVLISTKRHGMSTAAPCRRPSRRSASAAFASLSG
jgi:hypothetical protein